MSFKQAKQVLSEKKIIRDRIPWRAHEFLCIPVKWRDTIWFVLLYTRYFFAVQGEQNGYRAVSLVIKIHFTGNKITTVRHGTYNIKILLSGTKMTKKQISDSTVVRQYVIQVLPGGLRIFFYVGSFWITFTIHTGISTFFPSAEHSFGL